MTAAKGELTGPRGLVLGEVLRRHAAVVPDKPALIFRDGGHREVLTYGQLDARANRFAHLLAEIQRLAGPESTA